MTFDENEKICSSCRLFLTYRLYGSKRHQTRNFVVECYRFPSESSHVAFVIVDK